jgi:flotillin
MDQAQFIGIAVGLGFLGLLMLIIFIKANMVICQPNEIVILAGRKRKLSDGSVIGYRVIRGGRGFKWPFIESVARLTLTTTPIEITLGKAMCSGMIPVSVEGRANVKLAGRSAEGMENAIERFLGKSSNAMVLSAQQTLEGALRGVIATVTPEEANEKRLELADQVAERARGDLSRLGIVLDFFQIQSLSDDQGYLDAIGRKRNAVVQRDAQIAEAKANAEARQVAAAQRQIGREAEIQVEMSVVEKENALEVHRAELEAKTNRAQERAKVAGKIARTEDEIKLETKRIDLRAKREEADTVVPAKAGKQALELKAQGESAGILENGRATAEAVELMRAQWMEGNTKDLFLIQMMPELLDKVTKVVADNLHVDKLTVLDGGDGSGLSSHVRNITSAATVLLEQMKTVAGVDLAQLTKGRDTSGELPQDLSR